LNFSAGAQFTQKKDISKFATNRYSIYLTWLQICKAHAVTWAVTKARKQERVTVLLFSIREVQNALVIDENSYFKDEDEVAALRRVHFIFLCLAANTNLRWFFFFNSQRSASFTISSNLVPLFRDSSSGGFQNLSHQLLPAPHSMTPSASTQSYHLLSRLIIALPCSTWHIPNSCTGLSRRTSIFFSVRLHVTFPQLFLVLFFSL
jgi:hypothetical protein